MQRFGALICGFWLLAGSTNVWSKSQSDSPSYEPPRFEDMPAAPASAPVTPPAAEPVEQAPDASAPGPEAIPVTEPAAEAPPVETPAEPPPPAKKSPVGPTHYRVRIYQENGDCLWRIAEKVYGDRSKWRLIYLANRDIIHDPNKIYPKMKLKIPPADWQPDMP